MKIEKLLNAEKCRMWIKKIWMSAAGSKCETCQIYKENCKYYDGIVRRLIEVWKFHRYSYSTGNKSIASFYTSNIPHAYFQWYRSSGPSSVLRESDAWKPEAPAPANWAFEYRYDSCFSWRQGSRISSSQCCGLARWSEPFAEPTPASSTLF